MVKSYVGDIGTRIRTTLSTDLTNISTAYYKIKKPNGDILKVLCTIESILEGIVYYDIVTGDFNYIGVYYIQTELIFTDTSKFLSETKPFEIFEEYK